MRRVKKPLGPGEWKEVWALFDRCLSADETARLRLLEEQAKAKPWLQEEVRSLLENAEIGNSFLETSLLKRMSESQAGAVALVPPPEIVEEFRPQRYGKYLLVKRLGRGGMAEVFLAKVTGPRGFERWIAVKRVRPEYASDAGLRAYFDYEAQLSSRLNHANIVHIYDFGEYDGAYLLAMEYVNGKNLGDILERAHSVPDGIPVELSLYIAARVADGLDYAHNRKDDLTAQPLGIIHRDITPRNIMISFDGTIKLVDFGIAKAHDRTKLTGTGHLRGTLGYLSPEMASGQPVSARSDVFSLSAILYELLAGKRLFTSDDWFTFLGQLQDRDFIPRQLETLPIDNRLRALLNQGLSLGPDTRLTAALMRDQLDAVINSQMIGGLPGRLSDLLRSLFPGEVERRRSLFEALPEPESEPVPAEKRSPLLRWAVRSLVIASVAALAVLGGLWKFRSHPSASEPPSRRMAAIVPCQADAQRLCPNLTMGEGLANCLSQAEASLTEACRSALFARPCARFFYTYCSGAKNPRAAHSCFKAHWDRLSDACRDWVNQHEH